MFRFRLDGSSGVPPYLQLVHQVRQSLLLGYLREGDRLPTVKDVASDLAINPNTVVKAYRQLEHEGLAGGRPGQGTFITATSSPALPDAQEALRASLEEWLRDAEEAGLNDEAVTALIAVARQDMKKERVSMTRRRRRRQRARRCGPTGSAGATARVWGLRDCTLEVPAGAIVGLVGPNGAGKTTLLEMIIGLLAAHRGADVGLRPDLPAPHGARLARVGYVAQNHPLYPDFSVADMFHLGRAMNPSWDQRLARARMDALDIPLKRKIKALSGGQQAQVSLAMALAKRAPLLVLDEPVSSLDPVARLEFMRELMAAAVGAGLTVIIASHVVAELERLCDWLIVLAGGHVQLAGPTDDLLAAHRLLTVPRATPDAELARAPIHRTDSDRHSTVLVRTDPARLAAQGAPRLAGRPGGLRTARPGLPAAPAQGDSHRQPCPGRGSRPGRPRR